MAVKGIEAIKKAMEKYQGGGGKTKFFSLPDNGDTAQVRYLHTDDNDLNIMVVHKVKINEKDRWVVCTEDDNCPLCLSGNMPQLRMFLYLIDRRDGELKLWERGKTQIPEILGFIERYGNLNSRDYEIVRHGRKGDPKTRYQHFPMDKKKAELPEKPEVAGDKGFVLVKTIAEMKQIVAGTYDPMASRDAGGDGGQGQSDEDLF